MDGGKPYILQVYRGGHGGFDSRLVHQKKHIMQEKLLLIRWMTDKDNIDDLSDMFIANADEKYISHGEVQCGRASSFDKWSENIKDVLNHELSCVDEHKRVVICQVDGRTVGFGIIEIHDSFAVFDDIIVDRELRRLGIGSRINEWVESELSKMNVNMVFLEIGTDNEKAKKMFTKNGYKQVSVMMFKGLYKDVNMQEFRQSQATARNKCSCDQEAGVKDRIRTAIRMGISLRKERGVQANEDLFKYGVEGIVEGAAREIIRELGLEPAYKNIRSCVDGLQNSDSFPGTIIEKL